LGHPITAAHMLPPGEYADRTNGRTPDYYMKLSAIDVASIINLKCSLVHTVTKTSPAYSIFGHSITVPPVLHLIHTILSKK